ncbi:hypothetical protein [Stenotrophomonas sp. BIGb0135]|uniref:hypothetical protein n=1 Tax=Stenotrophomonas sp. BIGb0135 TaxID=2940620 RepID=UPI0021697075|nr:hypothetical protein [Stenotrophomonas sp. BIGb0135]MCS4233096.1 hypothetical protein [Stenotrophomonas sp. BIGb0135]
MSIYGDLSKPQRSILRQLLQESAVSIDTAHRCSNRRVEPYWGLRSAGLICVTSYSIWHRSYAYLTPEGLALVRQVAANASSARYSRFQ